MKITAHHCWTVAFLALAGEICLARVIGEDTRRQPGADEAALLDTIGLVFCSREVDGRRRVGAGTGTIVGSRSTVLTAAHVFTDQAGRQGPRVDFDPVSDCTFRQYDTFGELIVETGFINFEIGAYRRRAGLPNQDWAVLRTGNPLPNAALPFADQGSAIDRLSGLPVKILAFHADLRRDRREAGRMPLVSEGEVFEVVYGGYTRLAHTADMERMSSGAALVYRTDDGQHVVVGINRSAANLEEFNLAVPLTSELRQVLRSFAFGLAPDYRLRVAYSR